MEPEFVPFERPTTVAKVLRRYKRFLADVELADKTQVQVHVPNPGSMQSCFFPDQLCLLTPHDNPRRKLSWTLEAVQSPSGWIGVNTHRANGLASRFLNQRFLDLRSEVTVEQGWRADFTGRDPETGESYLIEVKNISLVRESVAAFPDAPTLRGQNHLERMLEALEQGRACGLLFVIQRTDLNSFHPAFWIDPKFAELFWKCVEKGIWLAAICFEVSPKGFGFAGAVPLRGRLKAGG
jgi:sugar fermentation stimulation protein A